VLVGLATYPGEMGPQHPEFHVERSHITVSDRDAARLVQALEEDGRNELAQSAARKIEDATALGSSTTVELAIGEDEGVLAALASLTDEGDFLSSLARLETALKEKIDSEG
jgi:hypothetical protein